ncbi:MULTISPECIES: hypothetical protein [unclassified Brenneria]|uniref:hypothetical protein n=1 Tax=unclassified Brenneria TaxID=2634434 RepID=UPI0018F06748|nr:hypothetical protein [Brenneria sp. L3-3C-1]MBJ7222518.1 hypothetical protein [Brenneria sp. L3-3C-1]MEE3643761.1 hypothetical protein [Brenneria sp. L3_3C_1]
MKRLINELNKWHNEELSDKRLIDILTDYVSPIEMQEYIYSLLAQNDLDIIGYEHQLGFYKFVIAEIPGAYPRRIRLHFWKLGKIGKDVHDHIASIASRVLHGTLLSRRFNLHENGEEYYRQTFMAAGPHCEPNVQNLEVKNIVLIDEFQINSGEIYYVNFEELHSIEPMSDYAITLVLQDSPVERDIN